MNLGLGFSALYSTSVRTSVRRSLKLGERRTFLAFSVLPYTKSNASKTLISDRRSIFELQQRHLEFVASCRQLNQAGCIACRPNLLALFHRLSVQLVHFQFVRAQLQPACRVRWN